MSKIWKDKFMTEYLYSKNYNRIREVFKKNLLKTIKTHRKKKER